MHQAREVAALEQVKKLQVEFLKSTKEGLEKMKTLQDRESATMEQMLNLQEELLESIALATRLAQTNDNLMTKIEQLEHHLEIQRLDSSVHQQEVELLRKRLERAGPSA